MLDAITAHWLLGTGGWVDAAPLRDARAAAHGWPGGLAETRSWPAPTFVQWQFSLVCHHTLETAQVYHPGRVPAVECWVTVERTGLILASLEEVRGVGPAASAPVATRRRLLAGGLLLNPPLFAIGAFVIVFGPLAVVEQVRRSSRLRRGLCPWCSYPIGEGARCSECGAVVGADTGSAGELGA